MLADKVLTIRRKVLNEAKKFLNMFLYFWILLSLFALHKYILVEQSRLGSDLGFALVNALILAKVMLLGETINLADRFKEQPLIYPIVYKSAIFSLLLIGFNIVEESARGLLKGETIAASIHELNGGRLGGILVISMIMFVTLIPFFAFKELGAHIGAERLYELFFIRRLNMTPDKR
ncbi:hypothetical protein [Beijerinckia mobilis]|uniref:hypothetical protein n=1 Tax=Beijerinckia mobilis TaxID=231434 RepID=UPI0005556233|nr:hypothetical protein [Beijerinckia mobilis]